MLKGKCSSSCLYSDSMLDEIISVICCRKSCLCNVPYIVLIPYFSRALIRVVLWDSVMSWDVVVSSGNGESLGKVRGSWT